ncbi:MAG: Flp pilus assembly complex ATPase component TadA [Planctomycetes bacterium]|nr:Flp pilus assembly complex ATPase component TadA [Planctomycetota bacterium]
MARRAFLGKILESKGYITQEQLDEALEKQKQSGQRIGEVLAELGYVTDRQVSEALADQFGVELVNPAAREISEIALQSIPKATIKEHLVFPIERGDGILKVAMVDPMNLFALDNLRFATNCDIQWVLCCKEDLENAVHKHYGIDEETVDNMLQEFTESDIVYSGGEAKAEGQEEEEEDAPIIRLVQLIITEALRQRASDIHIEPMENRLRIRYRIDGDCFEVQSPPKRLQGSIISRIKIMADIDIAEKRKPTDGRIKMKVLGRAIDLRVSCLPASHGESVVMRILDKQSVLLGIQDLGFMDDDYAKFQGIIKRPTGLFLVTGPTGSGKTTTLYAALNELNRPDVKIITAENPVEYNLSGINQAEVKEAIGYSFGRILRAMLRQAPNVILVGEIRDTETAEIAVQAALTGHLVFSTLHTNDAPSSLTRLIDMGVAPFLVSSSIQAVMAQRLLRTICKNCKTPTTYTPEELNTVGLKPSDVEGVTLFNGAGCSECRETGYRGRLAIFELMEMNASLRDMAFKKEPIHRMREEAIHTGMKTLQQDGVRKILSGVTTVPEVLAVTAAKD